MLLDEQQASSDNERSATAKRTRISFESDSEDDALPGTSTMTLDEVLDRASSLKKKKETKEREKALVLNIFLFLFCFLLFQGIGICVNIFYYVKQL